MVFLVKETCCHKLSSCLNFWKYFINNVVHSISTPKFCVFSDKTISNDKLTKLFMLALEFDTKKCRIFTGLQDFFFYANLQQNLLLYLYARKNHLFYPRCFGLHFLSFINWCYKCRDVTYTMWYHLQHTRLLKTRVSELQNWNTLSKTSSGNWPIIDISKL